MLTRNDVKVIPEMPFFYAEEHVLIQCTETGKIVKAKCLSDPLKETSAHWSFPDIHCNVLFNNVSVVCVYHYFIVFYWILSKTHSMHSKTLYTLYASYAGPCSTHAVLKELED